MTPGKYLVDGYDVLVGYIGTNFEEAKITILVRGFVPDLCMVLPDNTPDAYLPVIVSVAVTVRNAKEAAREHMDFYAKNN
jgi:hypothetical protein